MTWHSNSPIARLLLWGHNGAYRCLPFIPRIGIIVIHPDYRNDVGLLRHEKTHRRQHRQYPFTFVPRILFSHKFRMWAEMEAFAEQCVPYPPEDDDSRVERFAEMLATNYHLKISPETAYIQLRQRVRELRAHYVGYFW